VGQQGFGSYGWQKLYEAVRAMARSEDCVQDRLSSAYVTYLARVGPEHLPADERERFARVKNRLAPGGSGVRAMARNMSADEASELIGELVGLYNDVTLALGGQDYKAEDDALRRHE
jgi:hypothetical protein